MQSDMSHALARLSCMDFGPFIVLFSAIQRFFFFFFQINHVPALMVLLVNEINFRDKLQSTQVEKNHTFVHDLKRVFIAPFGKG